MLLWVCVEHLSLLPVIQGVVYQSGQHHVIVKVWGVRVCVKIDRVKEDSEPDDYNDDDVMIIMMIMTCLRRGRRWRSWRWRSGPWSRWWSVAGSPSAPSPGHQSDNDNNDDNDSNLGLLLPLGQAGGLQEHVSPAEGVGLIVIVTRPPNPEGVISLARSPPEYFRCFKIMIMTIDCHLREVTLSRLSQPQVSTVAPEPKSQLATVLVTSACRLFRLS